MPPDEETPRRRTEDHLVSYKDMVEFVAKTETDLHSIRAEGFLSINREMERSEARIGTHIKEVRENLIQKIDGYLRILGTLKKILWAMKNGIEICCKELSTKAHKIDTQWLLLLSRY
jgi:hypothetical protein